MKSKVTVELDFDDKEPFISIVQIASDDVRDKLIKHFTECLGFKKEVVFQIEVNHLLVKNEDVLETFYTGTPKQFILKLKK